MLINYAMLVKYFDFNSYFAMEFFLPVLYFYFYTLNNGKSVVNSFRTGIRNINFKWKNELKLFVSLLYKCLKVVTQKSRLGWAAGT